MQAASTDEWAQGLHEAIQENAAFNAVNALAAAHTITARCNAQCTDTSTDPADLHLVCRHAAVVMHNMPAAHARVIAQVHGDDPQLCAAQPIDGSTLVGMLLEQGDCDLNQVIR